MLISFCLCVFRIQRLSLDETLPLGSPRDFDTSITLYSTSLQEFMHSYRLICPTPHILQQGAVFFSTPTELTFNSPGNPNFPHMQAPPTRARLALLVVQHRERRLQRRRHSERGATSAVAVEALSSVSRIGGGSHTTTRLSCARTSRTRTLTWRRATGTAPMSSAPTTTTPTRVTSMRHRRT